MTTSVYSLYVSFYALFLRKGQNKEVQRNIFKRQVIFVIVRLLSAGAFTIIAIQTFINQFNPDRIKSEDFQVLYEVSKNTNIQ